MTTTPDNFRDVLKIDLSAMHAPEELSAALREMADNIDRRGWKDYEGTAGLATWTIYAEPRS
jgi:hypothetical protein